VDRPSLGMRASEAFGGWCLRRLASTIIVEGLENIPQSGSAILASNHISWVDPVFLACWLTPATGRPITWMGKSEAMRWPIVGTFLRVNGVFGVKRGQADLEAFRLAEAALRSGGLLGIYPEGTRSKNGRINRFHDGAGLLAIRSGAPLIPVAVSGTERLWAPGAILPRRVRSIKLVIGKPLQLSAKPGERLTPVVVTARLHEAVNALLPDSYRA